MKLTPQQRRALGIIMAHSQDEDREKLERLENALKNKLLHSPEEVMEYVKKLKLLESRPVERWVNSLDG